MIVSDRTSTGYSLPTLDAVQQITISPQIPSAVASIIPKTSRTAVAFSRPLVASPPNKAIVKGSMSFIACYGLSRPASDSPSSTFSKHDERYTFTFDFLTVNSGGGNSNNTTPGSDGGSIVKLQNYALIHGILMAVAWLFLPVFGIFIARFLKNVMGKAWYHAHLTIMFLSTLISLAGIILVILSAQPPYFSNLHQILGLIIGIDSILQTVLGFVSNRLFSPERESVPWWDMLHWWNGRVLVIAALVNVYIGMNNGGLESAYYIVYFVWIGISVAAFIAGQILFGQVHHVKNT
ncbi:hypothetical protein HK098_004801 [Nowakowskiella sp. JEL0407]|nr:hypothetical protein HK098_004801 [Nowakowskiella sp. JEL0407]